MNQGDIFLDYLEIRNQKLAEKKRIEREGDNGENTNDKKGSIEKLNSVMK